MQYTSVILLFCPFPLECVCFYFLASQFMLNKWFFAHGVSSCFVAYVVDDKY